MKSFFLSNCLYCLVTVLRIRDVYPRYNFFHPGSPIQGCQNTGSRVRIRIKEMRYFQVSTPKTYTKFSNYDAGCSSRISDPGFGFFSNPASRIRIPFPGVKKAPDPGFRVPDPDPQQCFSYSKCFIESLVVAVAG